MKRVFSDLLPPPWACRGFCCSFLIFINSNLNLWLLVFCVPTVGLFQNLTSVRVRKLYPISSTEAFANNSHISPSQVAVNSKRTLEKYEMKQVQLSSVQSSVQSNSRSSLADTYGGVTPFGRPNALTEMGGGWDGSMELRKAAGDWPELGNLGVGDRLWEGEESEGRGGGGGGGSGKESHTGYVAVGLKTGGGGGGGDGEEGDQAYSPSGANC